MPDTRTLGGGRPGQFRRPVASPTAGQNMIDTQRTPNVPRPQLPTVMPYQQPLTPEQPIPLGGGQQPIFNGPDFGGYDQQAVWRSLQDGQQTQQQPPMPPATMPQPGPPAPNVLAPYLEQAPQQQPTQQPQTPTPSTASPEAVQRWNRALGHDKWTNPQTGVNFNTSVDPNTHFSGMDAAGYPTGAQPTPFDTSQPVPTQGGAGAGFPPPPQAPSGSAYGAYGGGPPGAGPPDMPPQGGTGAGATFAPPGYGPRDKFGPMGPIAGGAPPQGGTGAGSTFAPPPQPQPMERFPGWENHLSPAQRQGLMDETWSPSTGLAAPNREAALGGPLSPTDMFLETLRQRGEFARNAAGAGPGMAGPGAGAPAGAGGEQDPRAGWRPGTGLPPVMNDWWENPSKWLSASKSNALRHQIGMERDPFHGAAAAKTFDIANMEKPSTQDLMGQLVYGTPDKSPYGIRMAAYERQKMRRDEFRAGLAQKAERMAGVQAKSKERAAGRRNRLQGRKNVKAGMSPRMAFAMAQSKGKDGEFDFGIAQAKFGNAAAIRMMETAARTKAETARNDAMAKEGALKRDADAKAGRRLSKDQRKAAQIAVTKAKKAAKVAAQRATEATKVAAQTATEAEKRADDRSRSAREASEKIAKRTADLERDRLLAEHAATTGGTIDESREEFTPGGGGNQGDGIFDPTGEPLPKWAEGLSPADAVRAARQHGIEDPKAHDRIVQQVTGNPYSNAANPRGRVGFGSYSQPFTPIGYLGANARRIASGNWPLLPASLGTIQKALGY